MAFRPLLSRDWPCAIARVSRGLAQGRVENLHKQIVGCAQDGCPGADAAPGNADRLASRRRDFHTTINLSYPPYSRVVNLDLNGT